MKRIFLSFICVVMFIVSVASISVASSNEVHTLSETPPSNHSVDEIVPFGKKPPKWNASTHNLSVSPYNYQALDIGYRLFTDKWITGATSIQVTVQNWKHKEGSSPLNNKLTVQVYDESGKKIDGRIIIIGSTPHYANLSGLSSNKKYYVLFEVPTNGNKYSFNGSIKKR